MRKPETKALVSIGLPVYNGEPYLIEAIQSILNQTYRHFELIICDNASTDRTAEVCQDFAARDARIRYFRNVRNLGAARNFNLTVDKASGVYFKWSPADDCIAPEFLSRSVEVLDKDPGVVLCQSQLKVIDEYRNEIRAVPYPPGHASSVVPWRRFRDIIRHDRLDCEIFGLIRMSVLRRTRLLQSYIASDRMLRAELALLGRFCILPEELFFNRDHPGRSVRAYPAFHLRAGWFDPERANRKVFPHWRLLYEYGRAVARAPVSAWQRTCCYGQLIRWLAHNLNSARLLADIVIAVFPGSWRVLLRIASKEDWLRGARQAE